MTESNQLKETPCLVTETHMMLPQERFELDKPTYLNLESMSEETPCLGTTETIMYQENFELDKPSLNYLEPMPDDWSLFVGWQASSVEATIRQTRPDLNVIVLKEVLYFVMVMIIDDYYDSI